MLRDDECRADIGKDHIGEQPHHQKGDDRVSHEHDGARQDRQA
jgi:hypothetical protein